MEIKNNDFKCEQCGKCCVKWVNSLTATVDDIKRWKKEGRNDILMYVNINYINGKILGGDLFFDPKTGNEIGGRCPFLRKVRNENKYYCTIHETKPQICRDYPRVKGWKCIKDKDIAIPKSRVKNL